MANPTPEIMPQEALNAGAKVVGTGRSDFNNQINNLLAFPGIFRGVLDSRASEVTQSMKIAAAYALAELAREDGISCERILPDPFDERVVPAVANAVALAAREAGVARI
jgi:malate dehydrogenase (oxaloacetate-decarboxylating)